MREEITQTLLTCDRCGCTSLQEKPRMTLNPPAPRRPTWYCVTIQSETGDVAPVFPSARGDLCNACYRSLEAWVIAGREPQ